MDTLQELLLPLIIALVSVIVTAIITIQIKYAATKEEAYNGLKSAGSKTLYYLWVAFLIATLYVQVASSEELTRTDVFRIAIITSSLFLLIILNFMTRIMSVISKQHEIQSEHFKLFKEHITISHPEATKEKNENSNK